MDAASPADDFSREMTLRDEVETAYARARFQVFDVTPDDGSAGLTRTQAEVVADLTEAEAALRTFRAARHRRL